MIFAIGDIHGRYDLLLDLHKQIMEHSAQYDEVHTIICLGDYIDRGPQSKEVVEFLRTEPFTGFNHVYLKGNHEDMLIKSLYVSSDRVIVDQYPMDIERLQMTFLKHGGRDTLNSYGIENPDTLLYNRESIKKSFDPHREWYTKLQYYHIANGYMFVHAGIVPGLLIEDQNIDAMMWVRDRFINNEEKHEFMIIHGHTTTTSLGMGSTEPEIHHNRINIDTKAYETDILTAVCLDEAHEIQPQFLSTKQQQPIDKSI